MNELKPCLIDRNKTSFKELWQEASCFADDIVCAVGTDFMPKIAEAERKFICDLLNSLQQMEVVDAAPVVRCRDCKFGTHFGDMEDEWIRCMNLHGNPLMPFDGFCSYGERKEGAE